MRFLVANHRRVRCIASLMAAVLILVRIPIVHAAATTVTLDPAATKITFTLGATMHTVHGTFKLKSGKIEFDPATGKGSGAIIIDATSGDTDNSSRDTKMHQEVLESAKFPEIIFTPAEVKGSVAAHAASQVEVSGTIRLHGQDHPITLTISVQPGPAGHLTASTKFQVPYVKWGLKNPSTFILHVSDTVDLDVQAAGQIVSSATSSR
jgi:polyisoprenoid-binding protein YceI